ncbi:MAG: TRAP transporter substrate-binding protein [Xanthobacteraceae bacterium]|nr:TRAP transporter substrate-binding protein [Xanthobacteraceae bacterium]
MRILAILLLSWLAFATPSAAAGLRIAVGCPAVDSCGDWHWANDFSTRLRERGVASEVVLGGALGPDQSVVDQMSQGLVEVGLTNFVMVRRIDPLILGFLTPYMFDDLDHMFRAIAQSDVQSRIDASLAPSRLKLAAILGVGGPVGIFNSKRAIEKPADLAGLRFRAIDRSQLALYEAWGTQGVVVDMAEVSTSLQSGVIDGYINPPVVALIFQHTDFLKFYTDAGAGIGVRTALMSRDWYAGLDAKTRAAVDEAIAHATENNRAWTRRVAAAELKTLETKGVKVTTLSPEMRKQFGDLSRKAWSALIPPQHLDYFVAIAGKSRK